MEIAEYGNIYNQEEKHFFYVSVHDLVIQLIQKYNRVQKPKIIDAGCGTGGLMKKMSKWAVTTGIDISPEAIKFAKKRHLKVTLASVEKLPFAARQFDVCTCIDVLYHKAVKNDLKALNEIRRIVKINGILVARFQADKTIKSSHDKFVHSRERYTESEVKQKLTRAGWDVVQISHIGFSLWPLAKMKTFWEKINHQKKAKSAVERPSELVNTLVTWLLKIENWLVIKEINLPRGIGLVVVARRIN